ncbi:MAG: amidohydrolase family protein [Actinomycetota bacterium]
MTRTLVLARAVWAGDPPDPASADALVLDDGRIEWAGPRDAVPRRRPRRTVDLGDAVIVPAFVDPHHHLCDAVALHGWTNLRGARATGEVISRLRRAAASAPPGGWIVGWGYRETLMGRGHRLNRADLDRVTADRPVLVMHRSMHSGAANSAALAAVGFGRQTPRWHGGELERDLRGEPNGRAWERAFGVLVHAAKRGEIEAIGTDWIERARAYARGLIANGVVAIGDAGVTPHELTLLVAADLPIDVVAMPVGSRGLFATPREALGGPVTGEVMGRVVVGPLKLFADGAERACFRIPYPVATRAVRNLGRPGPDGETGGAAANALDPLRVLRPHLAPGAVRTGTAHYTPDGLKEIAREAVERGFRLAIHALGNEGVRWALEAIEGAGGHGHRIEHAMFAEADAAERMARGRITAVVQPAHLSEYGEVVRTAGLEGFLPPVPLRRFADLGVAYALSSDAPTADWPPLATMPVAVTRRTADGNVIAGQEAITPAEALRAQTMAGAELLGLEAAGAILPGHRADLAVLSGDPFEAGTEVRETWLAGSRAWPEA